MSKNSKFNVSKDKSKRTHNDIVFDSVMEMKFYRDWILPKIESGDIVDCILQKKFELQEEFQHDNRKVLPINYIADFVVVYADGHMTVFDVKGMADNVALLKRKLFWYKYPKLDYQWVCYSKIDGNGSDDGWVSYEKVKQGRKERKVKNRQEKINVEK